MLYSLLIGGICGWIAGNIMKTGFGFIGNIILGLIGGFVGGFLFGLIGLTSSGIVGNIVCGVVGSCAVIWLVRMFKDKV